MPNGNWQERLRAQGYVLFRELVPKLMAVDAYKAIQRDLHENYDPKRQVEYDNQTYCPALRGTSVIANLLRQSPIVAIIDEALGWQNIGHDGGQIAIRRAHNRDQTVPPEPHIDGIPTGLNGLSGSQISNFTALVGVFLTSTPRTFAGNFTVWPGSHYIYERYFRERGSRAMSEGMPSVDIGEPIQLMCHPGDVVFCHYQLGHTAAVNTSSVDRCAVYFRIWLRDIGDCRWQLLTHIWEGWRV